MLPNLRIFIGESPIRLVGYELPADMAAKFPEKHPASALNYVFNMQVSFVYNLYTFGINILNNIS